jgi:hypothetical protein
VAVAVAAAVVAAVAAAAADGGEDKIAVKAFLAIGLPLFLCTAIGCFSLAGAAAPPQAAAAAGGQTFGTPEQAVTAFVGALRKGEPSGIGAVLGPGSEKLLSSGDKYSDAAERQRFLSAYDTRHKLVSAELRRMVLEVGDNDWPLPIPLVESEGRWHFDAKAGAQELVDRRIGRDEIAAIRTSLAYVDAQKAFFALGGHYAQHLASTPGKHDGLYWSAAAGEPESPLAPLMAEAQEGGYPGDRVAGRPLPYYGYFFRILTGQGANASNGARSYLSHGRMTGGFALIAWPASYDASGIMSFIVNQDGIVFQKDLGPDTAAAAAMTKLFDPDLSWARVDVVN